MTIQPLEKLTLDLGDLLRDLKAELDDFAEGSVSVHYQAITMMPLLAQITIRNADRRLSYESYMVQNNPGMSDVPPVLNTMWWGLAAGRDAKFAISNTSDKGAEGDVFLDFQGKQHRTAPLHLGPRETKLLWITKALDEMDLSPSQASEGGLTIVARGNQPALIAQGESSTPRPPSRALWNSRPPACNEGARFMLSASRLARLPTTLPSLGRAISSLT